MRDGKGGLISLPESRTPVSNLRREDADLKSNLSEAERIVVNSGSLITLAKARVLSVIQALPFHMCPHEVAGNLSWFREMAHRVHSGMA